MFPCIFHDLRYNDQKNAHWRIGYFPSAEDVRYHGACQRARKKAQMCPTCYTRLTPDKTVWRYFRTEDGTLRPGAAAGA
jgi:hypothetical protein